jgi:hypothetical protein
MPILDGPWVVVDHDASTGCVDVVWKRFTPSRELRAILVRLRTLLGNAAPAPRWFLDHTRMKVVSPDDQTFILDGWLALWTAATPCRRAARVAFVNAVDVFGRRSVERLAARIKETYPTAEVGVFHARSSARQWLMGSDEIAGSNPA